MANEAQITVYADQEAAIELAKWKVPYSGALHEVATEQFEEVNKKFGANGWETYRVVDTQSNETYMLNNEKVLRVAAQIVIGVDGEVDLPGNWDAMSSTDRVAYIHDRFDELVFEGVRSSAMEYGVNYIRRADVKTLKNWVVCTPSNEMTPLEEAVTFSEEELNKHNLHTQSESLADDPGAYLGSIPN